LVEALDVVVQRGCSSRLREVILRNLSIIGWSSRVRLSHSSQISITATNGDVGLCLQTGNMSRFYADLLKLQYLHQKGSIRAAIYLLPTKSTAEIMGSNLAHFERLIQELKMFSDVITVPILVIGME